MFTEQLVSTKSFCAEELLSAETVAVPYNSQAPPLCTNAAGPPLRSRGRPPPPMAPVASAPRPAGAVAPCTRQGRPPLVRAPSDLRRSATYGCRRAKANPPPPPTFATIFPAAVRQASFAGDVPRGRPALSSGPSTRMLPRRRGPRSPLHLCVRDDLPRGHPLDCRALTATLPLRLFLSDSRCGTTHDSRLLNFREWPNIRPSSCLIRGWDA